LVPVKLKCKLLRYIETYRVGFGRYVDDGHRMSDGRYLILAYKGHTCILPDITLILNLTPFPEKM